MRRDRNLPHGDGERRDNHQQVAEQRFAFAGEMLRKQHQHACVDDHDAQRAAQVEPVAGDEEVRQQHCEDRIAAEQRRGVADAGQVVPVVAGRGVPGQQQAERAEPGRLAPGRTQPHAHNAVGDDHRGHGDQQAQHRQPHRVGVLEAQLDRGRAAAPERGQSPGEQVRAQRRRDPDARLRAVRLAERQINIGRRSGAGLRIKVGRQIGFLL